jgi:hypothetical protein
LLSLPSSSLFPEARFDGPDGVLHFQEKGRQFGVEKEAGLALDERAGFLLGPG